MSDDGYMEIGETGMIPIADGWFLDKETGNKIDPQGRVFDEKGQMVWDPRIAEEDT